MAAASGGVVSDEAALSPETTLFFVVTGAAAAAAAAADAKSKSLLKGPAILTNRNDLERVLSTNNIADSSASDCYKTFDNWDEASAYFQQQLQLTASQSQQAPPPPQSPPAPLQTEKASSTPLFASKRRASQSPRTPSGTHSRPRRKLKATPDDLLAVRRRRGGTSEDTAATPTQKGATTRRRLFNNSLSSDELSSCSSSEDDEQKAMLASSSPDATLSSHTVSPPPLTDAEEDDDLSQDIIVSSASPEEDVSASQNKKKELSTKVESSPPARRPKIQTRFIEGRTLRNASTSENAPTLHEYLQAAGSSTVHNKKKDTASKPMESPDSKQHDTEAPLSPASTRTPGGETFSSMPDLATLGSYSSENNEKQEDDSSSSSLTPTEEEAHQKQQRNHSTTKQRQQPWEQDWKVLQKAVRVYKAKYPNVQYLPQQQVSAAAVPKTSKERYYYHRNHNNSETWRLWVGAVQAQAQQFEHTWQETFQERNTSTSRTNDPRSASPHRSRRDPTRPRRSKEDATAPTDDGEEGLSLENPFEVLGTRVRAASKEKQ